MPRSLIFLRYLSAFEAVARLSSVRAAADDLNLSPSAISLQMKKLREITGIDLFEKSGRNIILTQAGREFSQAVSLTLGQLDSAVKSGREQNSGTQAASLTISVPTALGVAWLSSAAVEFAESRNIANLTIREAINASEVEWDGCDIAIVYDNPPFPGKFWRLLSEVRLRIVCSPILFPRLDLQHRDKKLNGVTLIHEDNGEEWQKWAIAARVSIQGSARVRVNSIAQAVASTVQGRGIALVSDILTRNYLIEGRLIQPFSTSITAACAYYIVCDSDRSDDPLLQSLMDKIFELLRPARS